jgi:hypothetical protein
MPAETRPATNVSAPSNGSFPFLSRRSKLDALLKYKERMTMKNLPLTSASIAVAVALAFTSTTAALATDIFVVDPISGDTISVTEVAFSTLTDEQRRDVGDQLGEQGYQVRGDKPANEASEDHADVEVVDPTSGETVALSDIDVSSLSDEDRQSIGDQLAEQGVNPSRAPSDDEEKADVDVVDPTSGETVSLADVDVSNLSDEDRRSIGDQLAEQGVNPEHGGRGGRRQN